jgi:dTDP-4-dehydrorhamnose 3,5-epimerase-like enzyme/dTDP-4-dehydrorhamnose reductase
MFVDNRGYNIQLQSSPNFAQQFISHSKKNVLRGIHCSNYAKQITVLSGSIIDYVIDMTNYTFKKYTLNTGDTLTIPKNHGHLFISLEDNTIIFYQLEGVYNELTDININYRDPYIQLDIDFDKEYIISNKDLTSNFTKPIDYILLGNTGFLGGFTAKCLKTQNKNFVIMHERLDDYETICKKLKIYKPKYVICAAGISGRPTIEWCESNPYITYKTNFLDTLHLIDTCSKLNIHITIYGSGSVYKNIDNTLYTEKDEPNNNEKVYLKYRIMLENCIKNYKNCLYLRIQYPIAFNNNPKCFFSKMLTRLETVNDIPVNITFLPTLIPLLFDNLIEKNINGILNFVNPGSIRLPELLTLYSTLTHKEIHFKSLHNNNYCGLLNTDYLESILKPDVDINIKTAITAFLK